MTSGDAEPVLLATKLHAPRRRRGAGERPRLNRRVVVAELPVLTLVSAPAGFGKTTLLAEWFAGRAAGGRPTAWLSLDAGDNDPVVFWRYIVAAVHAVAPEAGDRARSLLRESPSVEPVVAA